MHFQIIPTAEASVVTLVQSINRVLINPLILLLIALAVVYFIYGVVQYFMNPDSEEIRKKSKQHMLWGVIGLFIMTAVFGIMNLILGTVRENNIKIDPKGNYQVGNTVVETKK